MAYNRHSYLIDWTKKQKDLSEKHRTDRKPVQRGSIFNCQLGENIGHEQSGRRPVLVVSDSGRNASNDNITVIPLTSATNKLSSADKEKYRVDPNHIFTPKDYSVRPTQYLLRKNDFPNLKSDSIVMAECITTISKIRIDNKSIELLSEETMKHIDKRILTTLNINL